MKVHKQVSAFLVNKPGRLANICAALAKQKINILAMTVMDAKEHGVLRLVTDDPEQTIRVLREIGTPYSESEVLLVEMANRPGALARVCERLASEHINIDYAYCSAGAANGKSLGVFRVSNLSRAVKALGPIDGDLTPKKKKTPPVRRNVTVRF